MNNSNVISVDHFEKLTKQELLTLKSPIKQLNFKFATREHALGYINLLLDKINAIKKVTRFEEDFDKSINFDCKFVYYLLVDASQVMKDYLRLKDEFMYQKYAEIEKDKMSCESCKIERNFSVKKQFSCC